MLSPMMQCGGRIRVKGCQFATGDGSTKNFQLVDRHGHPVTKDVHVLAMHQTDWQGRLPLSNQPRTNLCTTGSVSNGSGVTVNGSITGPGGINLWSVTTNSTGFPYVSPTGGVNAVAGAMYSRACIAKYVAGSSKTITFESVGFADVSRPVFDLTTGVATGTYSPSMYTLGNGYWFCFEPARQYGSSSTNNKFSTYVGAYGANPIAAGDNVVIGGFQWIEGATTPGVYIPTTSAPVTLTDYAADASGDVTLGQSPAVDATLDWDGTARRSA